jgi:hypothetical protein
MNQREDEDEREAERYYERGYNCGRWSPAAAELAITFVPAVGIAKSCVTVGLRGLRLYRAYNTVTKYVRAPKVTVKAPEGPLPAIFEGATGEATALTEVSNSSSLPEGHMWRQGSPLIKRSAEELHKMFREKKFEAKGDDPMNGIGSYISPKGRKYHIDPQNVGRYREPNHVDVTHSEKFKKLKLKKKRFAYREENIDD